MTAASDAHKMYLASLSPFEFTQLWNRYVRKHPALVAKISKKKWAIVSPWGKHFPCFPTKEAAEYYFFRLVVAEQSWRMHQRKVAAQ